MEEELALKYSLYHCLFYRFLGLFVCFLVHALSIPCWAEARCRIGFLSVCTVDSLGWLSFVVGALLYLVSGIPGFPPAVTTKKVSRYHQMSPGGRNCPQLKTTNVRCTKRETKMAKTDMYINI